MSIAKYEVFMKVVEVGSLTKAAELLGFTQSGVSHTISSLESEFGFTLLLRGRSGVKLTANGEQLLKPIREILNWNEQLKQVVTSIHGLETGTIRIGTFTSVSVHWLPGMMKQYQNDYPNIEFKLMEGDYEEIEQWIAAGEVDCGFITIPARGSFDVVPLKKDRMLAILPMGHPLSHLPFFPLSQIEIESFIIQREGSDYDVRRILDQSSLKPRIKFSSGDDYAIIAMVENGLGISILPELVLQGRDHNVHSLELEDHHYRFLGIAVHSMKDASPATKRFVNYVQQWLT
ncbi:LysR family transcriptional regulator [Paenibacillus planticolens]|uniref:LysR family transcriptional regulator n=1 Tax=Paenibacillus planticolens TaxID=2654976 RepID=A0ABX1ZVV7_9BACL|nr:LysR family transcriptional regulator [Paenibacillus planticolens]NOV03998.1 LysR family transcriptional regulator [Paenibacillus planticolens]